MSQFGCSDFPRQRRKQDEKIALNPEQRIQEQNPTRPKDSKAGIEQAEAQKFTRLADCAVPRPDPVDLHCTRKQCASTDSDSASVSKSLSFQLMAQHLHL